MRQIILCVCCIMGAFSLSAQTLSGKITNFSDTSIVYLEHYPDLMGYRDRQMKTDSARVINGEFVFSFEIGHAPRYSKLIQWKRVSDKKVYLGEIRLFLTKDSIFVVAKDSLKDAKIYNSQVNYDYLAMLKLISPIQNKITSEYTESPAAVEFSKEYQLSREKRLERANEELALAYESFIKSFPNSWVSLYAFEKRARASQYLTEHLANLYEGLGEHLKVSELGRVFADRIAKRTLLQPSAKAPVFSLPNTQGKQISLADYRGKYILLEFWATSCGACRLEAPHLRSAFEEYKEKGFDILSVSLDDARYAKREDWLAAIKKDSTGQWQQLCDFKGWESPVAISYDIKSIPQNYLIGPDGKIVSANIRGADLHDKLEDIFGD